MSERTLEDRLLDAIFRLVDNPSTVEDARLAISVALTLARREGFEAAVDEEVEPWRRASDAVMTFPLPARTSRTLREEDDPEGSKYRFRYNPNKKGYACASSPGCIESIFCGGEWYAANQLLRSLARITLWHDLMTNPYKETQVPVDPEEVLP